MTDASQMHANVESRESLFAMKGRKPMWKPFSKCNHAKGLVGVVDSVRALAQCSGLEVK